MMPRLNSRNAAVAGDRPQRLGRLLGVWMSVLPLAFRVTAVVSMMKKATRLEKPMPTQVSQPMRPSSRGGLFRMVEQRPGLGIGLLVLDLLRALPEEQVGADGGAEDGDDQGQRLPPTGEASARARRSPTARQSICTVKTTPT